jgi:coproporphyrinogen III oxidase
MAIPSHPLQPAMKAFVTDLRNRICGAFEKLEDDLTDTRHLDKLAGRFTCTTWQRPDPWGNDGGDGGGGEMSVMKGRVFEKVGVNISEVYGTFSPEFRDKISGGAESDGAFWACGLSLVAHMQSPFVPAIHMNQRMIVTSKSWFGGGIDLNPVIPDAQDTADFHDALKAVCDRYNPAYYTDFKAWADRYFFLPHRNEHRGVGGVFYDDLNSGATEADFAFIRDMGTVFTEIYPKIVRRHMNRDWTDAQREHQLIRRGRYAEFNLLYDRGTQFGLKTGGNTDAILMSMPPEVKWG